jgi:hypothetical protein
LPAGQLDEAHHEDEPDELEKLAFWEGAWEGGVRGDALAVKEREGKREKREEREEREEREKRERRERGELAFGDLGALLLLQVGGGVLHEEVRHHRWPQEHEVIHSCFACYPTTSGHCDEKWCPSFHDGSLY